MLRCSTELQSRNALQLQEILWISQFQTATRWIKCKSNDLKRVFPPIVLDSITKRIRQLEDLITDNNASNLAKQVALLSTTIATGSALKAVTTSITNQLEANGHSGKIVSIETLLDSLVILYDECSNSSLRREKTVSDFLELCKRAACGTSGFFDCVTKCLRDKMPTRSIFIIKFFFVT